MINRRQFLTLASAASASLSMPIMATGSKNNAGSGQFPDDFIWGAASAGHQVEGNNVNSDIWLLENVKPSLFKEPSGDACNSFELWETDLDLCKALGLSAYRFSIEWARIQPEPGFYSQAMIDHYKRIIEGCHKRNLVPMVSFNHFASPQWFAARGGWTNPQAPQLFADFCQRAASDLADGIGYAVTFNEPNLLRLLKVIGVPPIFWTMTGKMLDAAAQAVNSETFCALNSARAEDLDTMNALLIEGHKLARAAIKGERSTLNVGFTLAMLDEVSDGTRGGDAKRDEMRDYNYGDWLALNDTDFIGVQNYERVVTTKEGKLPVPEDAQRNHAGRWVEPTSLANCVEYTYHTTQKPIIVTEHGIGTENDAQREWFITESLRHLQHTIEQGVPVKGYVHWTLLDNFEWVSGYSEHFGLHTVDRTTFERKQKPSAKAYSEIVKRNRI